MSLPYLPLRTGDVEHDVQALYTYLYDFLDNFDNSAGSAIDPSVGQGGDSSLTIVDIPTGITYTPGSSLSIDGTIFGHIDVAFTKPDRVVDIIIFYKEASDTNYKQSYASESPFRLIGLMVGTQYMVYMAGQAANGSLGPVSPIVTVTIPTDALNTGIPTTLVATATYQSVVLTWVEPIGDSITLEYQVQRATNATFTANLTTWFTDSTKFVDDTGTIGTVYYYRVQSIDRAGSPSGYTAGVSATTLNVPDDSIITSKILNKNVTYAKIQDISAASRILLRGSAAGAGVVQEGAVGSGLSISGTVLDTAVVTASGVYTPTLTNVANLDGSTAYECQYLRVGSTVTVSGFVDVNPTAAGVATELGISFPIASAIAQLYQCGGVAAANTAGQEVAGIAADTTNDRAKMIWTAGVVVNTTMFFTFTYRII